MLNVPPPPPPRKRKPLVALWERLTTAPVKRPNEINLVAGVLAALSAAYAGMGLLTYPLYVASYPWQREALETGTPIGVLYNRQLLLLGATYGVLLLCCASSLAALRMRRWGRVCSEAFLWLFAAYVVGVAVWMNPFKWGVSLCPLFHWPPALGYFLAYWLMCFRIAPVLVMITPCALGIRVLHRPHVAAAFTAAEVARQGRKTATPTKP